MHTSHRRASLTGVQLLQGMNFTEFQILALTAKLTQTVPPALRSYRWCLAGDRHFQATYPNPTIPPAHCQPGLESGSPKDPRSGDLGRPRAQTATVSSKVHSIVPLSLIAIHSVHPFITTFWVFKIAAGSHCFEWLRSMEF
jgi:hypothetical protein